MQRSEATDNTESTIASRVAAGWLWLVWVQSLVAALTGDLWRAQFSDVQRIRRTAGGHGLHFINADRSDCLKAPVEPYSPTCPTYLHPGTTVCKCQPGIFSFCFRRSLTWWWGWQAIFKLSAGCTRERILKTLSIFSKDLDTNLVPCFFLTRDADVSTWRCHVQSHCYFKLYLCPCPSLCSVSTFGCLHWFLLPLRTVQQYSTFAGSLLQVWLRRMPAWQYSTAGGRTTSLHQQQLFHLFTASLLVLSI